MIVKGLYKLLDFLNSQFRRGVLQCAESGPRDNGSVVPVVTVLRQKVTDF